ncbi:MAG TPA: MarR family transcriptional regulator [Jatrophihabitans sp.]|jgi:DNA-binding MarR family transcriptional regulator
MSSRSTEDAALVRDWAEVVRGVDAVQHGFAIQLETLDMTLPYFSVLTLLLDSEDQRLPMSRIARDLAMTSGGFTKLADRMARDGLIDRRGSSGDRRVVFAALTESGEKLAREALEVYQRYLREQVLPLVPEAELRNLSEVAGRLVAVRHEESTPFELSQRPNSAPERRAD